MGLGLLFSRQRPELFPVLLVKTKWTAMPLIHPLMSKVAHFGSKSSPHTYLSASSHLFFRPVGYRLEPQLIFHSGPTTLWPLDVQFGAWHPAGRDWMTAPSGAQTLVSEVPRLHGPSGAPLRSDELAVSSELSGAAVLDNEVTVALGSHTPSS